MMFAPDEPSREFQEQQAHEILGEESKNQRAQDANDEIEPLNPPQEQQEGVDEQETPGEDVPATEDASDPTGMEEETPEEPTEDIHENPEKEEKHAYVQLGEDRIDAIQTDLKSKYQAARALMNYLESCHAKAEIQDDQDAKALEDQGLIVKAQIPIGPSQLSIENQELSKYGLFGTNLIVARDLLEQNRQDMLDRSGNGPTAQTKTVRYVGDAPGYLKETSSVEIRSKLAKEMHDKLNPTKKQPREEQITSPSSASVKKLSTKSKTNSKSLSTEQQVDGERILNQMQNRLSFLRNPRYDKGDNSTGLKSICSATPPERGKTISPEESLNARVPSNRGYFSVTPSQLIFEDHESHKVYDKQIQVKNICAVSRNIRVLPPSTEFFIISGITFPNPNGSIAPGLSCTIRIQFTPETPADYHDSITIQHEMGEFVIPVKGIRQPPVLSISRSIDVGCCLVGSRLEQRLQCQNSGGRGRFWLLKDTEDEDAIADDIDQPSELKLDAFTISPTEFELLPGEKVEFVISYFPRSIASHETEFVMICDNCQVLNYKLIGNGTQIEIATYSLNKQLLSAPDPAHSEDKEDSLGDSNQLKRSLLPTISFDALAPGASAKQDLVLSNKTSIDVQFQWELKTEMPSAFTIDPPNGMFEKNSSRNFTITFAPTCREEFRCEAIFMILDIPPCAIASPEQQELLNSLASSADAPNSLTVANMTALELTILGAGRAMEIMLSPSGSSFVEPLFTGQTYSKQLTLTNNSPAPIEYEWNLPVIELLRHQPCLNLMSCEDTPIDEFTPGSRGGDEGSDEEKEFFKTPNPNCEDPTEESASTFLDAYKSILQLATTGSKTNRVSTLTILPASGTLLPNESCSIDVYVLPHRMGTYKVTLSCSVQHKAYPLESILRFDVRGAQIQFLQPELDFGLVSVGGTKEDFIEIKNLRPFSTQWNFRHMTPKGAYVSKELKRTNSNESMISRFSMTSSSKRSTSSRGMMDCPSRCLIQFEPDHGQLAANETQRVKVICVAGRSIERFRASIECDTIAGNSFGTSSFVGVRAEIQSPTVYLTPMKMNLGITYVGVPVVRTFKLINLSNITAKFRWQQPNGTSPLFDIVIEPKKGILESKETCVVKFEWTPRTPAKVNELFACNVRGMGSPIGCQIEALQKGLVLSYSLLDTPEDAASIPPSLYDQVKGKVADIVPPPAAPLPRLQFGEDVEIFQRRKLKILIQNYSGIDAHVNFAAQKYPVPSSVLEKIYAPNASRTSIISSRQMRANYKPATGFANKTPVPPASEDSIALLSDRHEKANAFTSKKGHEYLRRKKQLLEDQNYLGGGGGVAFLIDPPSVDIKAWQQEVISITCFNDMPGKYVDTIVARVDGAPPTRINTNVVIRGCPLSLDANCVGLHISDTPVPAEEKAAPSATLSWGQVPTNTSEITKTIRVINTGPVDAEVEWKLVDIDSKDHLVVVNFSIADTGLVDLSIDLRDDDHNFPFIIEPERQVVPKHSKKAFKVTFHPSDLAEMSQALMIADAKWLHTESRTSPSAPSSVAPSPIPEEAQESLTRRASIRSAVGIALLASSSRNSRSTIETSVQETSPGCMKIKLFCDVIQPRLLLDKQKQKNINGEEVEGGIKFEAWSTHPPHHRSHTRFVCLVNRMATTLTFGLKATDRYEIVNTHTLAPPHPLSLSTVDPTLRPSSSKGKSHLFSLPPGESVQLDIDFVPEELTSSFIPSTTTSSRRVELQKEVAGELQISFSNGSAQEIPLRGYVYRPMVVASPSEYSFGTVRVGTSVHVTLYLSNPTVVTAEWSIRHIPAPIPRTRAQIAAATLALSQLSATPGSTSSSIVDDTQVFTLSCDKGSLEGPSLPVQSAGHRLPHDSNRNPEAIFQGDRSTRLPLELRITFTPDAPNRYKTRFRVDVVKGEGFDIVLEGKGTWEETTLHDQDRPTRKTRDFEHSDYIFSTTR